MSNSQRHRWLGRLALTGLLLPGSASAALASAGADPATERLQLAAEGQDALGPSAERIPLSIDALAYQALWDRGAAVIRAFPLTRGRQVDLELKSFSVAAADARFLAGTPHGDIPYRPTAMRFYRGRIAGDAQSLAYLWLSRGRVGGFVWMGGAGAEDLFLFGPRSARLDAPEGREMALRSLSATSQSYDGPYCGADQLMDVPHPARLLRPGPDPRIGGSTLLRATIAIDATVEYYGQFGNLQDATTYAQALMGAVSAIYERDVQCVLEIGFLRIFTAEPDPYTSGAVSTFTLLNDLQTEWTNNPAVSSVNRTVTHLFTYQPGEGGIAYRDTLCDYGFGYGVSSLDLTYAYPNPGYTWDADVVSHELGHNFGSPHTHCYQPEIDECYAGESGCYNGPVIPQVGTIMSYCHLVASKNLLFHPRVIDLIRPNIEAASCIEAAGAPGQVGKDPAQGLRMARGALSQPLADDDGAAEQDRGFTGTTQAAWIKRFQPPCLPYRLAGVEVQIRDSASVQVGRPIRLLVYHDPGGTGSPASSALIHSQDVQVQVVSGTAFNRYTLPSPIDITAGDVYLGFFDLVADPATTYIMTYDDSHTGDSFQTTDSTAPGDFWDATAGSYMVRGRGSCVGAAALILSWGAPCNEATVPGQDFAVYEGIAGGRYDSHQSVTCSTNRQRSLNLPMPAGSTYYLVVPQTAVDEGDYGPGVAVSPQACKPQNPDACN